MHTIFLRTHPHTLTPSQEERRKEMEVELNVMETNARKRSLGNIRFIGELFKLKVYS